MITDNLKFKGWCVEHQIQQKELAEVLGIDVANVNLKVNGKQPFTLKQVKILCNKYNLPADMFI